MIAHITGKLVYKSTEFIVVEVNGLGYRIFVSLHTFYGLPEVQESVQLRTRMIIKDEQLYLYGFLTEEERDAFDCLISVSGIGPRLARNILSGITPRDLGTAIYQEDIQRLKAIPGVGRRIAERIIVDLREKGPRLKGLIDKDKKGGKALGQMEEDVLSALISLGYKREIARRVIEKLSNKGEIFTIQGLLKDALRELGK